ncbi:MAG: MFS transporter [Parasporobacterium sp.]|nr:MFS transporter [Parasporobacterium sp.]
MNHSSQKALKSAILTMSLVQLGTNAVAPILADISAAFPGNSDTTIQFLMTFPILFTMILELASALLSERLPKKTLSVTGLVIVGAGGILAFCFHQSLTILFVWAAVIGIGLGLVAPIAPALINETFEGQEKQTMLSWQNSASTIGSMIMTFACGFLAAAGWNFGYLVYLICIPGILCTLFGLRSGAKQRNSRADTGNPAAAKPKFRLVIWREMVIACLFLMLYSAIPANIAMLVSQKGIGEASLSGILTTLFSLAGMLVGLVFGLISRVLRRFTNTAGAVLLAAGTLLMGSASSLAPMLIGCMLAGTSMSLIMPVCMGAASRLRGYETLNAALIMASTSVGIFITPLLTNLTEAVTGSALVATRFIVIGIIALLLAGITVLLKAGTGKR